MGGEADDAGDIEVECKDDGVSGIDGDGDGDDMVGWRTWQQVSAWVATCDDQTKVSTSRSTHRGGQRVTAWVAGGRWGDMAQSR